MPSRSFNDLLPWVRGKCARWLADCAGEGIRVRITCTYRSQEEQDALYEQGRSLPGRVVTWTRHSRHTQRTAWDFCVLKHNGQVSWDIKDYLRPGEIAEALGLEWGGRWHKPDAPHIQTIEEKGVA